MNWPAGLALAGCVVVVLLAAFAIWAAARAGKMADNREMRQDDTATRPGSLPPLTGPELASMRMDSMERRIAHLERRLAELERLAMVDGVEEE